MGSLTAEIQDQLEAHGDYVVRANKGWFAVFAHTWDDRLKTAIRRGREGPNLVVYRTESSIPNDHHVLPFRVARELLVEETVTRSNVNGSVRWNLTLKDNQLHVSHRTGKLNVKEFYGALLIGDNNSPLQVSDLLEHYANFYTKVENSLRDGSSQRRERLRNSKKLPLRKLALVHVYDRNPDVVAEVLSRASGVCEVCRKPAPFLRAKDGNPYLEVHHKVQLANGGEDTVGNAIATCPNCHRKAHFGEA